MSGMGLGVAPRMDTKMICVKREDWTVYNYPGASVQHNLGGGAFNEHKNLHFDIE